jgi:hypothetical protein
VTTEVQWSELQRDPKGVAALADQGTVRVRRRTGGALLLIREQDVNESARGAVAGARLLRTLARLHPDQLLETLRDEYPWLDHLPADGQAEFMTDLIRTVQTASEFGRWVLVEQNIIEWRATAEVYADPELLERLTRSHDGEDYGPVPPPVLS